MRAGGSEVVWHGEHGQVVEDERLVCTLSDEPPGDAVHAVVVIELKDAGDEDDSS